MFPLYLLYGGPFESETWSLVFNLREMILPGLIESVWTKSFANELQLYQTRYPLVFACPHGEQGQHSHRSLFSLLISSQTIPKLTCDCLFSYSSSYQYFLPTQLFCLLYYLFIQKRNKNWRGHYFMVASFSEPYLSPGQSCFFFFFICLFVLCTPNGDSGNLQMLVFLFLPHSQWPLSVPIPNKSV